MLAKARAVELRSQGHDVHLVELRPSTEEPEPKASARAITINFITGCLGSAILSLPWSVAGSSMVTSVSIVAVALLINAWTISIVVRAAERYNLFDLGALLAHLPYGLGPPIQVMTNVFVWISMFLCLVSYVIVIRDSARTLVMGTWLDSQFLLGTLASICVLPLCFLSQRMLERTSSIAIAINLYLFILIGVLYGRGVSSETLPEGCCIFGVTSRGVFAMITVMFQAVSLQMCVLPMYKELEGRSPQKFDRIIAAGFGVLFFLFSGFSCVGYLLIGQNVKSNILEDLPTGLASSMAHVGIIFTVACVYPIMVYPMTAPIQDCTGTLFGLNRSSVVAMAKWLIVTAAMVTALCVRSLGIVNVINGAMSATVFVALVPSIIGLGLMDFCRLHKAALVMLLVVGTTVFCMGFVFSDNFAAELQCSIEA